MICALEDPSMRILMMTIVLMVGLMFATTGFADSHAENTTDAAETEAEENPAVKAAPPDTTVAAPAETDTTDASETATDDE